MSTASSTQIIPLSEDFPVETSSDHPSSVWMRSLEPFSKTKDFEVTNGSLIAFSDTGLPGKIIKAACGETQEGFTHVGLAFLARPSEVLRIVQESIASGGLSKRKKKYHRAQLTDIIGYYNNLTPRYPSMAPQREDVDIFCFEATGSVGEMTRRLKSRVKISPLSAVVASYKGDVCIRSLNEPLPFEPLRDILVKELGLSYVRLIHLMNLVKSAKNTNTKAVTDEWFCSELVAHIYKQFGLIPVNGVLSKNVVPFQFQSDRLDSDLLLNKAHREHYIKRYKPTYYRLKQMKLKAKNRAKGYKVGKYLPFQLNYEQQAPTISTSSSAELISSSKTSSENSRDNV